MRTFILSLVALFATTLNAQDLTSKVSKQAFVVFKVNGEVLSEKIAISELEKSLMYQELADELIRGGEAKSRIDDYGVDYTKEMIFASEFGENDVNFSYFSYFIKDNAKFEAALETLSHYKSKESKDGFNIIHYDYNVKLYWKDNYALLMWGDYIGSEFDPWYSDYNYEYEITEETTEVVEAPAEEVEEVPIEEMTQEEWVEYMKKEEERIAKEEAEKQRIREEKRKKREEKIAKKKEKVQNEMWARTNQFFSNELASSKDNFQGNFDDKADASLWYANYFSIMDWMFMGGYYGYRRHYGMYPMRGLMSMTNFFQGMVTTDLYLGEEDITTRSEMEFFGEMQEHYANIMSSKIDKKFVKYLSNDDIGYMSMSSDMEEALKAYPYIVEGMFSTYDTTFTEEYTLLADIVTMMVDEESIAEAITGDAVMIFHNLSMREVTYYTYDYDEEYNYKRVPRTKMELVPDMTLIVGSERTDLIERGIKLGVKHDGIVPVKGGYKVPDASREFPFEVYLGYSDDMFITTTSQNKLEEFMMGGSGNKLDKSKVKSITKNSGSFYLNMPQLMDKMLSTDEFSKREKRTMGIIRDNTEEISAEMYFDKDKAFVTAKTGIPAVEKNGATYLMHFIDKLIEAEKSR